MRNEEVLHSVKEARNILHLRKTGNATWTGGILRRNRLLKHVIKGKIEVMGRRGRRWWQLLDYLKEMT